MPTSSVLYQFYFNIRKDENKEKEAGKGPPLKKTQAARQASIQSFSSNTATEQFRKAGPN